MIAFRPVVRRAAAWTRQLGRVVRRPDVALPGAIWLGLVLWARLVFGLEFVIPGDVLLTTEAFATSKVNVTD